MDCGATGRQDRTKGAFGGCLTLILAVNAKFLWGNCILAMKIRQKIRPERAPCGHPTPGHYADGIRRKHASRLFSTDWDSIIEIH